MKKFALNMEVNSQNFKPIMKSNDLRSRKVHKPLLEIKLQYKSKSTWIYTAVLLFKN